ncbi:MAG: glutamine-synthetase adenylyltransferase, partial [Sphingomonadales bacterium]
MTDDALDRARTNSPFLALLIDRHPALVTLIKGGDFDQALAAALAVEVDGSVAATLRRQRQGVALVTAIADLCGAWDLTRVTRILSDFADTALDRAIEAAIRERYDCAPAGFAVIGLGKHGG